MDPILKKFGLFETRKTLHSTPNKKMNQSVKTSSKNKAKIFEDDSESLSILNQMISFLQSALYQKCQVKGHERNLCKYFCLEKGCSNNIGCSYCFLHSHTGHKKSDIQVSLRQLKDLRSLAEDSNKTISSRRIVMRNQMIKDIDQEIDNICKEFHHNLQFLKNKAINEVDKYLFEKYQVYETINKNYTQIDLTQDLIIPEIINLDARKIERDLQEKIKDIEFQKINIQIYTKYFEEMNGAMGHFMASFKKSHPKLYPHYIQKTVSQFIQTDQFTSKT